MEYFYILILTSWVYFSGSSSMISEQIPLPTYDTCNSVGRQWAQVTKLKRETRTYTCLRVEKPTKRIPSRETPTWLQEGNLVERCWWCG